MINAMIHGRVTKAAEMDGNVCRLSICDFERDKNIRLTCTRGVLANQLMGIVCGEPVAVAGALKISPVVSKKGEAHALLTLEVTAVLTVPKPSGLLARFFK